MSSNFHQIHQEEAVRLSRLNKIIPGAGTLRAGAQSKGVIQLLFAIFGLLFMLSGIASGFIGILFYSFNQESLPFSFLIGWLFSAFAFFAIGLTSLIYAWFSAYFFSQDLITHAGRRM